MKRRTESGQAEILALIFLAVLLGLCLAAWLLAPMGAV